MRKTLFSAVLLSGFFTVVAYGAEIRYTGASGRDPFAPPFEQKRVGEDPGAAEKRLQSLIVQGVVASSANPRAIVNGKIYKIGSEVMPGVKIVRIEQGGVFVSAGEKEILLSRQAQTTKGKNRP